MTDDRVAPPPLWDAASRRWDGPRLHTAIVARRLTINEFAGLAGVSAAVVYKAVAGGRTSDSTTVRIFDQLDKRQPMRVLTSERE